VGVRLDKLVLVGVNDLPQASGHNAADNKSITAINFFSTLFISTTTPDSSTTKHKSFEATIELT
jgi:hypothetical protein